jgi:hypothetical protein
MSSKNNNEVVTIPDISSHVSLTWEEVLNIHKIEKEDSIIPLEVAAKLKGVSEKAILAAIRRGKLKRVNGVLLSSLEGYEVDPQKRMNGILGQMAKQSKDNK